MNELIVRDICDTDLYKISMGQLFFHQFEKAIVKYTYINRAKDKAYPAGFYRRVREQVEAMADLSLTNSMYDYLVKEFPWLKRSYLEWLKTFRFDPSMVEIDQLKNRELIVNITGPMYKATFWEVPLLYIITQLAHSSESGNIFPMHGHWQDTIEEKASRLFNEKINWIDFGTRRRATYEVQDKVCDIMKRYSPTESHPFGFRGTSNVYLAKKHGIKAHGTNAHELTMLMQSVYGVSSCNKKTMDHWIEEFDGDLGIALTDTITTPVFLQSFSKKYAKLYDGIRQDSGNPKEIGDLCIKHYESLGIDPTTKILVLSDSLNTDKAIELNEYFKGRIKVTMGIGTHFTNDVGWVPSNHVIKLTEVDNGYGFQKVIKLSDDPGKHTGDEKFVECSKYILGIH